MPSDNEQRPGTNPSIAQRPDPAAATEEEITSAGQRVAAIQGFFGHLKKAFKNISLYRHATNQYPTFLEESHRSLTRLLDKHDSLTLKVEPSGFKFLDSFVYKEEATEQNIAFKFYRDGIRLLVFRQGLTQPELLGFVSACLTVPGAGGAREDMVSLLWKQGFQHLEYVVMESYSLGSESTEQTEIEVDLIIQYLYHRMTTQSRDQFQFAKVSLDDLELEIRDVEAQSGVTIQAAPPTEQWQQELREEIAVEERTRMLPRLAEILLRVFEQEIDEEMGTVLEEAFLQVLDGLLLQENLHALDMVLVQVSDLVSRPLPHASQVFLQYLLRQLLGKLCEAERIDKVGDILESTARPEMLQNAKRYLDRLDARALSPLLNLLERLNRPEARRLVSEALVRLGQGALEALAARLNSPKPNLVRDLLWVIDRLNPPNKVKLVAGLLGHPNLAIRIDALNFLGTIPDMAASAHVMKAFQDLEPQVRMAAARLLPNFDPGVAKRTLLAAVNDPAFAEKSPQEQVALHAALATTNAPEALAYFQAQLRQTSLLTNKKLIEHKRNIVSGLALSGSIDAFRFLKAELAAGVRNKELEALMERACKNLKEKLLTAQTGKEPA